MQYHWYVYLEWGALGLVTFLSVTVGARAERSGALLILLINLVSDIAMAWNRPSVPEMTLFWLDLVLAVGLLAITFRFNSLWLGAAMLLQSVILFCHALALDDGGISYFTFMLTNNVVSWLMYGCLLGATLMSWRARQRLRTATRSV